MDLRLWSEGREVDAVDITGEDNTGDDDDGGAVAEADVSSCVSLHTSWRGERCEGALTLLNKET